MYSCSIPLTFAFVQVLRDPVTMITQDREPRPQADAAGIAVMRL